MSKFCPKCMNDTFRENSWDNEQGTMFSQWRCDYCGFEYEPEMWLDDEGFEDESDDG